MKIGNIIKSYDFPGNTDCYMIGRVTDIISDFILCDTVKVVFDSKEISVQEKNKQFRTVKQGLSFGDSHFERVVVLG